MTNRPAASPGRAAAPLPGDVRSTAGSGLVSEALAAFRELVLVVDADFVVREAAGREGLVGQVLEDALGAALGLQLEGLVVAALGSDTAQRRQLPSALMPSGLVDARAAPMGGVVAVSLREAVEPGEIDQLRKELADTQRAMAGLAEALEDRVLKRTQALTTLVEQLEQANLEQEQVRRGLVADLRPRTSVVLGALLRVLGSDALEGAARGDVEMALAAGLQVRDHLDELAVEPSVNVKAATAVDLGLVVDGARRRFQGRGLAVPIALIGRPETVATDPWHAELALSAAVGLALDAGSPHVEVRAVTGGLDVIGHLPRALPADDLRGPAVDALHARQRDAGGAATVAVMADQLLVNLRYALLTGADRAPVHTRGQGST